MTKNQKAISKWKKVTNTIKFINVSTNCVVEKRPSTINHARKYSKWTIVRIAFSAVNFLLRKSKKEKPKVHVQYNIKNVLAPHSNFFINILYENVTFNPQIVNKILNSTPLEKPCHCKFSKKEKHGSV